MSLCQNCCQSFRKTCEHLKEKIKAMSKRKQPPCPECEKLAAASEKSNEIGHFLDWMFRETDYVLCKWYEDEGEDGHDYYRVHLSDSTINDILAEFFHIDLDKVEQERKALLEWVREVQS